MLHKMTVLLLSRFQELSSQCLIKRCKITKNMVCFYILLKNMAHYLYNKGRRLTMKKWLIRGSLLIGYCVPLVFLSTYGEVTYDTMWLYALMIVGFSLLCFGVIKSKEFIIVILGNIISFLSSYTCSSQFYADDWNWYFKPFTPNMLITRISIVVFVIQLGFVLSAYKKHRKSEHKNNCV